MIDFSTKKAWLDGVCNPVRNVLELKRYGRGCKPRPAQRTQFFSLKQVVMALYSRAPRVTELATFIIEIERHALSFSLASVFFFHDFILAPV
jgi:hypothetical protein